MSKADRISTSVAVDTERIPSAKDSARGFAVDVEQKQRIQSSRGLIKILIGSAIIGASVVGSPALDVVNESHQRDVNAGISKVKEGQIPMAINRAQLSAMRKFYGVDDTSYDYESAKKMMDQTARELKSKDWQLPVGQFVSADQVKISEDGKSFEWEGQNYSFTKVKEKDGDVFILVAKSYEEDNLIRPDQTHMVDPMLVGGAKYEADISAQELGKKATDDARGRLEEAFEKWKNPVTVEREPDDSLSVANFQE